MNKILVLHPKGYTRDTFFPDNLKEQLNKLGKYIGTATKELIPRRN